MVKHSFIATDRLKKNFVAWLEHLWYQSKKKPPYWLIVLGLVYASVIRIRQFAYAHGVKKVHPIPVPVIVVGNITVGGTGKTPLTIWLARFLVDSGYRPGIVSRGYGGEAKFWPQTVRRDSDFRRVGDEAIVIARQTRCPMAVGPDRVSAACSLLEQSECDVIISDDGLQHYALARDIEIAVVDAARGFGNGYCLPAGPLREPVDRIRQVDLIVHNGPVSNDEFSMAIRGSTAVNIREPAITKDLSDFSKGRVHVLAGIGNPERFFKQIRDVGIDFDIRRFPDHYRYTKYDIDFDDDLPILMTEKDAVKCEQWAGANHWFVPVQTNIDKDFGNIILNLLSDRSDGRKNT